MVKFCVPKITMFDYCFSSNRSGVSGKCGSGIVPLWTYSTDVGTGSEPSDMIVEPSSHERYAGGSLPDPERASGIKTPASVWREPSWPDTVTSLCTRAPGRSLQAERREEDIGPCSVESCHMSVSVQPAAIQYNDGYDCQYGDDLPVRS